MDRYVLRVSFRVYATCLMITFRYFVDITGRKAAGDVNFHSV